MKLMRFTFAVTVVAGAVLASAAAAGAVPVAHVASTYTVSAVKSRGHTILVDKNGLALYVFTHDKGKSNSCVRISGCSSVWPTFRTRGGLTAGPGVKRSLLGTAKVGNQRQVTYGGHPLYEYAQNDFPGFTAYVGTNEFGGDWDAVAPSGALVK